MNKLQLISKLNLNIENKNITTLNKLCNKKYSFLNNKEKNVLSDFKETVNYLVSNKRNIVLNKLPNNFFKLMNKNTAGDVNKYGGFSKNFEKILLNAEKKHIKYIANNDIESLLNKKEIETEFSETFENLINDNTTYKSYDSYIKPVIFNTRGKTLGGGYKPENLELICKNSWQTAEESSECEQNDDEAICYDLERGTRHSQEYYQDDLNVSARQYEYVGNLDSLKSLSKLVPVDKNRDVDNTVDYVPFESDLTVYCLTDTGDWLEEDGVAINECDIKHKILYDSNNEWDALVFYKEHTENKLRVYKYDQVNNKCSTDQYIYKLDDNPKTILNSAKDLKKTKNDLLNKVTGVKDLKKTVLKKTKNALLNKVTGVKDLKKTKNDLLNKVTGVKDLKKTKNALLNKVTGVKDLKKTVLKKTKNALLNKVTGVKK